MNRTVTIKVKKLDRNAIIPTRANEFAAGYDLYALESQRIVSGGVARVRTGVAIEIPPEYYAQVFLRSGFAFASKAPNVSGVIDPDYRGDVSVVVINCGHAPLDIMAADRIAQFVILPRPTTNLEQVDELNDTVRGVNGFGSTGR